ncbi:MAG: TetM/TetW/TetO/TetS family tetracycline resistance ribosomal protection protein [Defluviitaleaceae bacterium]|nr:TetM/TetW/TetO/TetS family tetracycline resistance ribosomal protection protein [Defluviitaleaceae bacterium]
MKKLNIGIIAHVDAGKTTLTENILHLGGVIASPGRVDKGNTATDSMAVERRRGISVRAAAASFVKDGVLYNLIDTPGHVDFVAEVERSLAVLDGVVLVVSAVEGLQSQTRVLMDTIRSFGIPAVIFINKIDRMGADALGAARAVGEYMGSYVLAQRVEDGEIHVLDDDAFMALNGEVLYNRDDELLALFVENKPIGTDLFFERLYRNTRQSGIYPIFFGSALYGVGCGELFEAIPRYLPAKEYENTPPLSAIVFMVDTSGAERLAYLRIFGGCLRIRETVSYKDKEEKITRLGRLAGNKTVACTLLETGDVGVLYLKDLKVGDVIGEAPLTARKVGLARPTLNVEVTAKQPEQKRALYEALVQLADEDPLLNLSSGKKLNLRLLGEVQKEILSEILSERYGIEAEFSESRTVYMETPAAEGTITAPINRNGTFFPAGVGFTVKPLPQGSGLRYTRKVTFGVLEKTFQNAVEEAVYDVCKRGLYGWEITDCEVIFDYSDYDSVNGTPSAYRNLVPPVLMEVFAQCGMILLEPYVDFELRIPSGAVSKALYELARMNAEITETDAMGEAVRITGTVPADACKSYGIKVNSYTEGRGLWLTRFKGFMQTGFDQAKVNEDEINPAVNKAMYLMQKMGAVQS